MPERCPAGGDTPLLLSAGLDEVPDRLKARRPQVGPVRVSTLHRVAQDRDQLRVRDQAADAAHRVPVIQVQRCRLTTQRPRRGRLEECLVVLPPPHMLAVGQRVTGPAAGGWRAVAEEEFWFLDRRHVQRWVAGERCMQRGRARLRRADHQEVRQCHGASSSGSSKTSFLDYAGSISWDKTHLAPPEPIATRSAHTFPRGLLPRRAEVITLCGGNHVIARSATGRRSRS